MLLRDYIAAEWIVSGHLKAPKQGQIDTSQLASDLAEIVALWPKLPENIKQAIRALAKMCPEEH